MILVDTNIVMYAAGSDHPRKQPSLKFLEKVARGEIDAALDAEILQEILHWHRALDRWQDGRKVYDLARQIFPVVIPITVDVLDRARVILDQYDHLMARDALHVSVIERHGLDGICSYDRDFDTVPELIRKEPDQF